MCRGAVTRYGPLILLFLLLFSGHKLGLAVKCCKTKTSVRKWRRVVAFYQLMTIVYSVVYHLQYCTAHLQEVATKAWRGVGWGRRGGWEWLWRSDWRSNSYMHKPHLSVDFSGWNSVELYYLIWCGTMLFHQILVFSYIFLPQISCLDFYIDHT